MLYPLLPCAFVFVLGPQLVVFSMLLFIGCPQGFHCCRRPLGVRAVLRA